MAQILNFRTPEFRSGDADARRDSRTAEIIIFPGVRYERWDEPGIGAADAHGRARDVLELAE